MKVALLSGGVGGARFARGLVDAAGGPNLTIVGNVGDDLEVLGMSVSPDLDSILYALAGLHDEERGWGRAGETWEALGTVSSEIVDLGTCCSRDFQSHRCGAGRDQKCLKSETFAVFKLHLFLVQVERGDP